LKFALLLLIIFTLTGCTIDSDLQTLIDEAEASNEARRVSAEAKNVTISPVSFRRETDTQFALCYNEADTLNPVKCRTESNKLIMSLTHEGLFELSDTCFPVGVICDSFTYDGEKYVFTLNNNKIFNRSGAKVTGADVVYSLQLHLSELPSVIGFYADGEDKVVAELRYADGGLPARLTYPIIPSGTKDEEYPDGTGKYMLSDEGGMSLVSSEMNLDVIELYPIEDSSGSVHDFETKKYDLASTLPVSTSTRNFSGTFESVSVPTRNMHCIVFNTRKIYSAELRKYIASSVEIDPESIFGDNTDAAEGIFPENTYLSTAFTDESSDISEWNGNVLRMIVNIENEYKYKATEKIAESLRKNGIAVELSAMKWESFEASMKSGDFDLAYVQFMLPSDLSPRKLIEYTFFYGAEAELSALESAHLAEKKSAARVLSDKLSREMIILPICFEKKTWLTHLGDMKNVKFGIETPLRYIDEWIPSYKLQN